MKIKTNCKMVLLLLISFSTMLFGQYPIKKEISVKSGSKIVLDFETGASINIEGWDNNKAEIFIDVKGDSENKIDFDIKETSYGISITSEYDDWGDDNNSNAKVIIKVPVEFNVDFETTGGSVKLYNLSGLLKGTTMGGSLDLEKLKGTLDLKTMGGGIDLLNSEVDGSVETMGGSINLENIIGDVNVKTMGGSIRQHNVKSSKNSSGKEVEVTTMGGEIDVDEALFGANVKTMGGDININKVNKYLKAETMGGNIYIKEADAWVKAKTMGGDVNLKLVCNSDATDRDINLTSMSGDITLYVPDGFSMDIDIELVFTKKYDGDFSIISDFDINQKTSKEWKRKHGNKTKTIEGSAKISGGKNKITLKTTNGNVTIKKI